MAAKRRESAEARRSSNSTTRLKFVCQDCFADDGLKAYIANHLVSRTCSYCRRHAESRIAAPMLEVVPFIRECLDRAMDELLESHLLPDVGESFEAFQDFWHGTHPGLQDDLNLELENTYAQVMANPAPTFKSERLTAAWEKFCVYVKHHCRFVLYHQQHAAKFSGSRPWEILEQIGTYVNEFGLLRTLPTGSELFRGRQEANPTPHTCLELGPPPQFRASQSRMSPAGIPMFYGAFCTRVASAETFATRKGRWLTIARFTAARPLQVLDISQAPPFPSLFQQDKHNLRSVAIFMAKFAEAVSLPLAENRAAEIDYIPTQIVAEYFRHIFVPPAGTRLDGIQFKSSKARGDCVSLFCTAEECTIDPEDSFAKLCYHSATVEDVATRRMGSQPGGKETVNVNRASPDA